MASKLDFDLQSNKYIEIEKHYSIFNYYTIFNEIHSLLSMHDYSINREFQDSKFIKLLNTFQVKYNIDDDAKEKIQTFFMMKSMNKDLTKGTFINSYLQQFHDIMKLISYDDFKTPNTPDINFEKLNVNEFKDQKDIEKSMKLFKEVHLSLLNSSKSKLTPKNIDHFTSLIKAFYYQLNITNKWTKMICDDDSHLIIIPCFLNDDSFSDYDSYIQSMGGRLRKHYTSQNVDLYIQNVLDIEPKEVKPEIKQENMKVKVETQKGVEYTKLFGKNIPSIKKTYMELRAKGKSKKLRTKFNSILSKNVYFLKCIPNNSMKDEDYEIKLKQEVGKLESFIQKRFMDFLDKKSIVPFRKIILFYNDDDTLSTMMYGKNFNSQSIHRQINKYLIPVLANSNESIDIKTGIQQRRIQNTNMQLNDNLMVSQFDKLKQKRVFLDILRDKDETVNNLYETFFNFYVFIIQQYHDSLVRNDNIKLIEKVNDSIKHFKIKYSTKMVNEDLYNIESIVVNKNQKYTLELDDLDMFELEGYFQSKRNDQYKFKLNKITNCKPLQDILSLFNDSEIYGKKERNNSVLNQTSVNEEKKYTKFQKYVIINDYVNSLINMRKKNDLVVHSEIEKLKKEIKNIPEFASLSPYKIDLILYLIVNHSKINLVIDDYDFSFKLYVYNKHKNTIEFIHNGDLRHSRIRNTKNQVLILRSLNKQLPMLSNIYFYPNFMITNAMVKSYLQNEESNVSNTTNTNKTTNLSNSLLNILSSQEKLHDFFVFSSLHKKYNKYIYDDEKDRSKTIIKKIVALCVQKGNSFYMQKPDTNSDKKSNTDVIVDSGYSAYKINNVSNIVVTENEANILMHLIPSKELRKQEPKKQTCEEKKKQITQKMVKTFGKMFKNMTRKYRKKLRKITQ
jgi:hypothetical protein